MPSKLRNGLIGYGEAHAPVAPRVVHTMGFTAEVIAGLDIALWDLLGKYRQEPVWRLLGGAYRQTLPVYSSGIPGDTSEK